jgi:RNA polymerase sigma-70 factor (ECF subfamily)
VAPEPLTLAYLYAEHFRYVFRCLRSLGVSDRELDDAIQDVFLVVQKKLPEFDGKVSPKTWLYAIGLRIARRYKERAYLERTRRTPSESGEQLLTSPIRVDLSLEHGEQLAFAKIALEALDDEKREAFVLSQVEELSAPEIAEIIGIPVNTVYSRVRAARTAFNAEIHRLETGLRRRP